jgi:integrase
MRGSIVKRGKGYSVVLDLGVDPQTGKRRQKWHAGYRTKRAAEAAVAELVGSINTGTYVERSKQSLADFAGEWLAAIEPTVRASTHYSYARNLRLHVLPYVGSMPLAAVDAGTLNKLYASLLLSGRRNQAGGGLSPRSVRYVHTIGHRAFRDAVKWGRLLRNPADSADPPRATSTGNPDMVTWSPEELGHFLDGVSSDRLSAAYLLLATTGMRRGEALGLRWADVDLESGRAAIRQTVITLSHKPVLGTPKTAKGRRTISLDASTVTALRVHRKRQLAERCRWGPVGRITG